MARQQTTSRRLISIVGTTLVGLVFIILLGKLDGPVDRLITTLLGADARRVLGLLLSLVPTVGQALQAQAFDHKWFSPCSLQMLVSFWPLLPVMAGAV